MTRKAFDRLAAALVVGTVAAIAAPLSRPSIRMDGVGYYAPLASLVLQHDLNLENEIAHADRFMRNAWFTLPDGRRVDPYPVGAAVLWSPVMIVSWLFDGARSRYDDPGAWRLASPGFSRRYIVTIAIATALEGIVAAVLLWFTLRRRTSGWTAAAGVLAATLGTPFLYYTVVEPSYAHTASFLACTALLAAVLWPRRAPLWALGALWGLVSLVRYQDAVLGILVAPRLLEEWAAARGAPRRLLRRVLEFAIPAAVVFAPQPLFWRQQYGEFWVVPLPQGFMQWGRPPIPAFLFSTWQGAFLWSPALALGLAGIALLRDRRLRLALWIAAALEIYASAAAGDWWGSASFGARRLVVIGPIAALGVALAAHRVATTRVRRVAVALAVALLIGWTVRLTQFAAGGWLPHNAANVRDYARHYPAEHPWSRQWGKWDYGRFARELIAAERAQW
jgi:hypothetical protein